MIYENYKEFRIIASIFLFFLLMVDKKKALLKMAMLFEINLNPNYEKKYLLIF